MEGCGAGRRGSVDANGVLAEAHAIARAEHAASDAATVDDRAVGRVEILQDPSAGAVDKASM